MQTFEPEITSPERGDARSAILNAARALAQREGVENLTLGKVATEASLPRPVVFGQFVRKEDLLLCVAADSVATLARKMGGIAEPVGTEIAANEREGAVILTLPRTAEEAEEEQAASAVATANEIAMAVGSERRAAEAPVAEKSSSRAPDAWLERRLRVFERAMTAMEARQERVEKDSRAMVASAENSIKALEGTLNALIARVDESESRQKATADEIKKALSEASLRLQTVEGVARAALVENDSADADVAEVEAPVEPAAEAPMPAPASLDISPAEASVQPEDTGTPEPKSFLNAARASAIAAAASVETEAVKPKPSNLLAKLPYVIGGLIVVAVFIVAAGIAFSKGERDGRNEALRQSAFLAPHATFVAAAATPLDRLTKLAEAGNANAELAIANRYLDTTGPAHDTAAGMRWMARAAAHGNAVAQFALGSLYQRGVGTRPDPILAMHWYEAAALRGNRKAMHGLAIGYAEGLGGMKSPSEAVRWFSRAANLGYVDSQFNLAVLYERGDGVPQSLVDAFKWYAIAGAQGDAESKLRIDALRTQLSGEDLAAAQRAADAFRAVPFDPAANLAPNL